MSCLPAAPHPRGRRARGNAALSAGTGGKAGMISNADWQRICTHLHRGEPEARLAEQQRAYAVYLRDGSAAMTRTWTNSIRALRERARADQAERSAASAEADRQTSAAIAVADRQLHAQRIAEFERLLERKAVGPRQLQSAYVHAEVLQVRQQQRAHMAQLRAEEAAQVRQQDVEEMAHREQWLGERMAAFEERRRAQQAFKGETRKAVGVREANGRLERCQRIAEEKRQMEREAEEWRCEKVAEEQRVRQAKVAEKRRIFEEIAGKQAFAKKNDLVEAIDDKIIATIGQPQQYNIERNRKFRATVAERFRRQQLGAQRVQAFLDAAQQAADEADERRYEEARREKVAAAEAREEAAIEALRARRLQRQGFEAEARALAAHRRCAGEQKHQFKVATRLRNAEIGEDCKQAAQQKKHDACMRNRATWLQQIATAECQRRADKAELVSAFNKETTSKADREDAVFFTYAQRFIEEAKQKQRPLYPLRKCVERYRKYNGLKPEVCDLKVEGTA